MSMAEHSTQKRHFFLTRQPVITKNNATWAQSVQFRDMNPWDPKLKVPMAKRPELQRRANEYAHMITGDTPNKRSFLSFSRQALSAGLARDIPAQELIVEVPEVENPDPVLLKTLDALKEEGYRIAITDFVGLAKAEPLHERADIVKVHVKGRTPHQILTILGRTPEPDPVMVATGVDYPQLFNISLAMGFSLFQGGFFAKAERVETREMTPSQAAKLELFHLLELGKPDFGALSRTISMDAAISFRLLNFLNSAAFSFPTKIKSIDHAVVILGWEQIKTWLRIAILRDLVASDKAMELIRLAAHRSNFFKLCAVRSGYRRADPDTLFLLGLFSLLEPMMEMPMTQIVKQLPISKELSAGLCRKQSALSVWIGLATRMEHGEWSMADKIISHLGVDPKAVASSYYDAHVMAASFFDVRPRTDDLDKAKAETVTS